MSSLLLFASDNLQSLNKKGVGGGGGGGGVVEGERRRRSKTPRKDEFTEFSQARGKTQISRWRLSSRIKLSK